MTDTQELCGAKTSRGYNQGTASGRAFYAMDPRPEEVFLEDIAAQLSRICRYGGALKEGDFVKSSHPFGGYWQPYETYSVAQHSVLIADNVPAPHKLRALLHDAAEAYVGDVIKPLKVMLPDFTRIERRVQDAILTRFGLPLVDEEADKYIKLADYRAALTERRDLHTDRGEVSWGVPKLPPFDESIVPLLPSAARALFLQRFNELYKGE